MLDFAVPNQRLDILYTWYFPSSYMFNSQQIGAKPSLQSMLTLGQSQQNAKTSVYASMSKFIYFIEHVELIRLEKVCLFQTYTAI